MLVLCVVSNYILNQCNCFINRFMLKKNEIFYFQNNFNSQFHSKANNHALAFSNNITHLLPTNFCWRFLRRNSTISSSCSLPLTWMQVLLYDYASQAEILSRCILFYCGFSVQNLYTDSIILCLLQSFNVLSSLLFSLRYVTRLACFWKLVFSLKVVHIIDYKFRNAVFRCRASFQDVFSFRTLSCLTGSCLKYRRIRGILPGSFQGFLLGVGILANRLLRN